MTTKQGRKSEKTKRPSKRQPVSRSLALKKGSKRPRHAKKATKGKENQKEGKLKEKGKTTKNGFWHWDLCDVRECPIGGPRGGRGNIQRN